VEFVADVIASHPLKLVVGKRALTVDGYGMGLNARLTAVRRESRGLAFGASA
jgi:hypothetical protein